MSQLCFSVFYRAAIRTCSGPFFRVISSGGILLPSSEVFERFGAVFFSISPPTLPFIFLPLIQSVLMGTWNGGSWMGCGDLSAMGAVFYLGVGCQQRKPLDTPGTHLPFKRAAANFPYICLQVCREKIIECKERFNLLLSTLTLLCINCSEFSF